MFRRRIASGWLVVQQPVAIIGIPNCIVLTGCSRWTSRRNRMDRVKFLESEGIVAMNFSNPVGNRVSEERAIEGEGVILAALSTRVYLTGQRVAESRSKKLSAVIRRQPLGVNAHRDSFEAEGRK